VVEAIFRTKNTLRDLAPTSYDLGWWGGMWHGGHQ
jgi:hypothetical protein